MKGASNGFPFQGKESEGPERKPFGALDLETEGFSGEVLYATMAFETEAGKGDPDRFEVLAFRSLDGLIDELLRKRHRGRVFWVHNLEFDGRYIDQRIRERHRAGENLTVKPSFRGRAADSLFSLKIHRHKHVWRIYDSSAIWQGSLSDLARSFCRKYMKMGRSSFEDRPFDVSDPEDREYARLDSLALLEGMVRMDEALYEAVGVHLKNTAAATAMQAVRALLGPEFLESKQNRTVDKVSREAYFGGYVSIGGPAFSDQRAMKVDFKSMYAAIMANKPLPRGKACYTTDWEGHRDRFGIWWCWWYQPEMAHPPLPMREKGGPIYCYGWCEGWLDSIRIATGEMRGCTVYPEYGYVWPHWDNFLARPLKYIMGLREGQSKGSAMDQTAKLLGNSVFGKFGESDKRIAVTGYNPAEESMPETARPVLDRDGLPVYGLYWREVDVTTSYHLPHVAAAITSWGHRMMHEVIAHGDPESVLMTDTDGLAIEESAWDCNPYPLGDRPGELEEEGRCWIRVIAPKTYAVLYDTGKPDFKAKGIPKKRRREYLDAIGNGNLSIVDTCEVKWESPTSYLSFRKSGEYKRTYERSITDVQKSRSFTIQNGRYVNRWRSGSDNGRSEVRELDDDLSGSGRLGAGRGT